MGEVWLAEQTEPVRRQVALKVIKAGMDSAQVVARFEAERQALALMDHPAIATVFDGGTTPQGRPYFAMEYVKGEPITLYCDRHRLNTNERLQLFMQVCEGVQHAHQKGVIHRDLKPSNVLVTIQDDRPVPKIIDFGVAKATSQQLTERSLFTELGVLIGTPEYMSPEQAEMGSLDIDTRTDIYALGVLLYELLTGSLPFDRKELRQAGIAEIQRIIREKEPPRPSTRITQLGPASTEAAANRHTEPRRLVSELRGDLDWVTMRALEKDRTRRYQTANALAMDVRRHLANEPVLAGPPSATYRAEKFVRRHRLGVAAAGTLATVLATAAGGMAVQARRIARERDKAERLAAFMVEVFRVSDPGEARGNTVTAREVLDAAALKVGPELHGEPELQADLLAAMAGSYRGLGLFGRAGDLGKEVLRLRRAALGQDYPKEAADLNGVAGALRRKGELMEAERYAREALAIGRRRLGPEHVEVARSLALVGGVLTAQGRYPEAEGVYREACALSRRVSGERSQESADKLGGLGAVLLYQGRYDEAADVLREHLSIYREALGDTNRETIQAFNDLGAALVYQGKYGEAEPVLRQALAGDKALLGPRHPDLVGMLLNLGVVAGHLHGFADQEILYREALEIARHTGGGPHPDLGACVASLATCLARQRRLVEAEPLYREAIQIQRSDAGAAKTDLFFTLSRFSTSLQGAGRFVEAEALAREAVALGRKTLPPGGPDQAYLKSVLGAALAGLKRFAEGEPLLLTSQSTLAGVPGKSREAIETLRSIVAMYEAWGKPEKARVWRAKLEAQPSSRPPPSSSIGSRPPFVKDVSPKLSRPTPIRRSSSSTRSAT
jgi:non-specific serine/threonine protein kinase/serine/threonine-protein kinase